MGNWCYNEIYIVGGTEEQRKNLVEKIKYFKENSPFKNVSAGWIGKLSVACGVPVEEVIDEKSKYRASAFIQDVAMKEDYIFLTVESAWYPIDEYLKNLFNAGLPSLEGMKYIYYAEEWGNDIWETNDVDGKFFTESYYFDDFEEILRSDSFYTEEDLLEFINSEEVQTTYMIEKNFHSYEEIKNYVVDNHCDFTVRKLELVEEFKSQGERSGGATRLLTFAYQMY